MAAGIFLLACVRDIADQSQQCIKDRLYKIYDTKSVHDEVYLLKTNDDLSLIHKYIAECFSQGESYFLVDIADQPIKFKGTISKNTTQWMDNI